MLGLPGFLEAHATTGKGKRYSCDELAVKNAFCVMFPQVDLYPSTHELCDSIANHLLYTIVIRQCSLMLRYLVHFYRHYCYFDYVPGKYGGTSVD